MALPKKIPINCYEDSATQYMGKYADGKQFWGYETFVFDYESDKLDWKARRHEYVILHLFDKDGNHLEAKHWYAGTKAECDTKRMTHKLEEMVAELGSVEYTNIKVKLFQTVIDNIVFGLIPKEEYEAIDLEPSSTISLHKPWNGEYDT